MKTEKLEIEITKPVKRVLTLLVSSGLYGRSVEEAAERLLCDGLQEHRWLIEPGRKKKP